ncbi:MAG TPA: D-hexose-6-phosphate mutarotase [Edaphobacter sp.]|jgi:glucose-6-phosphate 1-epimerase|nr:D-hexose-6-phosphate mutarotase [Edaphobacter sp.]
MDLNQLNDHFGIPGVLHFDQHGELTCAQVTAPSASATVYLQGAHITHWQPAGQQPVLFLSQKSDFLPGKPIRGGVPIAFPWFATDSKNDRYQGKPGPSHGFARIQDWSLSFAALSGDSLHLAFTLGPTELSRQLGFDHFRLAFELIIGSSLTMRLAVANDAKTPLVFEEALHTYFSVGDARKISITGLEPTGYIDKTDNFRAKPAAHAPLVLTGFTDRVYPDTAATCAIHDTVEQRTITIEKQHSNTTVVFNPWKELPDMGPDEWQGMVCVETVNSATNTVTLAPQSTHIMQSHITLSTFEKERS